MNFLQKKIKANKTKILQSINIGELIEKSNYVQSKCINKKHPHEILGEWWSHTLPLKDLDDHFLASDNWDLPEDEVKKLRLFCDELTVYAEAVVDICFDDWHQLHTLEMHENIRACFGNVLDFLPPWMVFPLYSERYLCWRMGLGEMYAAIHWVFLKDVLTNEEFELYKKTYPAPCYLPTRYRILTNDPEHTH